jgi:hypothetical protein
MRKFKFFVGFSRPTLTASWEPEISDDYNFYRDLEAEEELTSLLSQEIARTIDNQIIGRLIEDLRA